MNGWKQQGTGHRIRVVSEGKNEWMSNGYSERHRRRVMSVFAFWVSSCLKSEALNGEVCLMDFWRRMGFVFESRDNLLITLYSHPQCFLSWIQSQDLWHRVCSTSSWKLGYFETAVLLYCCIVDVWTHMYPTWSNRGLWWKSISIRLGFVS